MRRRRGAGDKPALAPSKSSTPRSGEGGGRWFRALLVALILFGMGLGSGYVYATQAVFAVEQARPAELLPVPEVIGLSVTQAAARLEAAGLTLGGVDSIRHPTAAMGAVVGQAPFPGQFALPDASVDLSISLGPEVRPVPDVTRLRGDRALTVLETSGFQVTVDSIDSPVVAGQVLRTTPSAGTRLALPAQVRMTVSLGPPMVELPDLTGLTEGEARARLLEIGLEVGEIELESRFGFGQGDVLRTFPEAGASIPLGSPVRLVVRQRSLLPGGASP